MPRKWLSTNVVAAYRFITSAAAFARIRCRNSTQAKQANHVWKYLQAVKDVAPIPDSRNFKYGAKRYEKTIDPAEWDDDAGPEQVFKELLSIILPANQHR